MDGGVGSLAAAGVWEPVPGGSFYKLQLLLPHETVLPSALPDASTWDGEHDDAFLPAGDHDLSREEIMGLIARLRNENLQVSTLT